MPGILGIISKRQADECQAEVMAMLGAMAHEKFYASGVYFVPELRSYAGWVALDSSFAADQVFFNEAKDVALLLSGECFLDFPIKAALAKRHAIGENAGDWLVHLYEESGEEIFSQLNGLFSGLLIDRRRSCTFLFNDRYGFDRIYVHETSEEVYFASEVKALLRVLPNSRSFDPDGLVDYLAFGCTIEHRTLFRAIELLPAGTVWKFEEGLRRKRRYFSLQHWESQPALGPHEFEREFAETCTRIVPRYFGDATDVGVSLTAGLDTRIVMACRPRSTKPVCYTYDGRSGETLDTRLARDVAAAVGLPHHVLRLEDDFFSDFPQHANRAVYLTDGAFGVLGAHEAYLSAEARRLAPIRLTGVFGGEILRGVSTFKPLGLSPNVIEPRVSALVAKRQGSFLGANHHAVTFAALKEIPWNIFGSVAACRSQLSFRTPFLDNELVALAFRLPTSLRNSPKPALRTVHQNDTELSKIPTDMGLSGSGSRNALMKRILAKVGFKLDYLANEGLPNSLSRLDPLFDRLNSRKLVLGHHKFLRYRSWLRGDLADYLRGSMADAQALQSPLWNHKFLGRIADDHIRGFANNVREINTILTLAAVERLFFASSPVSRPEVLCASLRS